MWSREFRLFGCGRHTENADWSSFCLLTTRAAVRGDTGSGKTGDVRFGVTEVQGLWAESKPVPHPSLPK